MPDHQLDLRAVSLSELATAVRTRQLRAVEVVEAALTACEAQAHLNAWACLDGDGAIDSAAALDRRIDGGEDPGPLAGVPLGVKDLEDAAGFPTGYGSALHAGDGPATRDSIQVARLKAAGCVVLGKTTTSEFGATGDTSTRHWGATLNPYGVGRSSGGSSGGSATALAAGMVALATGSDAGGSIRIPSALCGLTGLKTTHGVIPLGQGVAPSGGVLTVRGPMARTAADTALALSVAAGPDDTDCFSLEVPGFGEPLDRRAPERIVWAPAPGFPVDAEVARVCADAIDAAAAAGVEVIEADRLFAAEPIADWFTLWSIYRERAHGHLRGTPSWDLFGDDLRALMDHGANHVDARSAMLALDAVHAHAADLAAWLERAPFVLTPTVAGQTAVSGAQGTVDGEETIFWAPFTQSTNLTRHPAGSVNVGATSDAMPVGLQVIGRHRRDVDVLGVLGFFEDLVSSTGR